MPGWLIRLRGGLAWPAAVLLVTAGAHAEPATGASRIGGAPPPCVTVEIAGYKAGSVDCAAVRLDQAAKAAQARAKADPTLAVPDARSSPLTVGLGSVEGSSQRLGGDLRGATRLPQRPVPVPPSTPFPRP